jgi:hypothetical protein
MKIHSYQDIIDIYLTSHDTLEIMSCHHSLPHISTEMHEQVPFTHHLTIDDSFFLFHSSLFFPVDEITLRVDTTTFRIERNRFKNKSVCCGVNLTAITDHVDILQHSHYSQVIYVRGQKEHDNLDSVMYVTWPDTTESKHIGHHFLYRFGIFSKCVVFMTRLQTLPLWHIQQLEQTTEPYHTDDGIFYTHSSAVKTIYPLITDKKGHIIPTTMFRPIADSPPQNLSKNTRELILFVLIMTVAVILCVICITLFCIQIKR